MPARFSGASAAIAAAIAAAWALALAAQLSGSAELVSHDRLIEGGLPLADAFAIHLAAWQAMVVAMMLPTSLPLVRMFGVWPRGRSVRAGRWPPCSAATPRSGRCSGRSPSWRTLPFTPRSRRAPRSHRRNGRSEAHPGHGRGVQFSSLKDACLRQCRHPGPFLLHHYRRGVRGALGLGARHGVFCLGCCWALMLLMFAVGTANLVWMAALTAIMVHEKTHARGREGVPITGVALLGAAAIVLPYAAWAAGVLA